MPVLLSVICLKSAHFISCLFYAISPLGSAVFYFQDQKNHFLFEVSKLIDENKVKNEIEKEIKSKIEQNRRENKTEERTKQKREQNRSKKGICPLYLHYSLYLPYSEGLEKNFRIKPTASYGFRALKVVYGKSGRCKHSCINLEKVKVCGLEGLVEWLPKVT